MKLYSVKCLEGLDDNNSYVIGYYHTLKEAKNCLELFQQLNEDLDVKYWIEEVE